MTFAESTRSIVSTRERRRLLGASVLGAWLYAGCSVYDSSLLPSNVLDATAGTSDVGGAPSAGASSGGNNATSGSNDVGGGGSSPSVAGSAGAQSGAGPSGGTGSVADGGAPSQGGAADAGAGEGGAPTVPEPHELALAKSALASSNQTNNDAAKGNDGDVATRWCAVNGNFPQWWRVDLGAVHTLSSFSVRFEYPQRGHSYVMETSQDDATYVAVPGTTATDVVGDVQSGVFPDGSVARYVRISVTNALPPTDPNETPHVTWACFYELSVLGF